MIKPRITQTTPYDSPGTLGFLMPKLSATFQFATGNSHAIWDHTVLPATRKRCESRLYPQPKQVLDLATPERCKAELTYVT